MVRTRSGQRGPFHLQQNSSTSFESIVVIVIPSTDFPGWIAFRGNSNRITIFAGVQPIGTVYETLLRC